MQVKSAKLSTWLNPKQNPSQVWVHFPIFLKLNVQSVIFSKFLHEIEAAAIYLVMEHGHRKSKQNSRICVLAQVKLVHPVWNLSDSSTSLDDRQIKGTWRCQQSRFLFPDSSRKDRSDSASRVKWSNFGEQTGFLVKWHLKKDWRNSILMTCRYPHRSDLGSAFDSWQFEAK